MKEEIVEKNNETEEKNKENVKINNDIKEELNDESLNQINNEQENIEDIVTIQEEIGHNQNNEPKKDKLNLYTKIIAIVSGLLIIFVMIFSVIFALINKNSNKIVNGVFIKGIDVSGLTKEEATEKLNTIFEKQLKKNITLKHSEYETVITPEQIKMNFKNPEAIELAYSIGRTGKILKDNYSIINANLLNIEINPAYSYDDEILTKFVTDTQQYLPDAVKQSGYYIEEDNLVIDKGRKGVIINEELLKKRIVEESNKVTNEKVVIDIPVINKEPEVINLQKIRDEIYKEPQDAYYTKNPFSVHQHVNGIDFKVTMEEAKNLLNSSQQNNVIIPLKITVPNITTNQIGTEAFPNLLATYSTTFSSKNYSRTTNIKLASNKINGVILMPGEKFSFNSVVGKRTAAAGYKTAPVYVNGKVENGIGGGICQVSSTLYNTALRANLEIVKRSNHRFATGYVPLSTDATVSWGGPEFIFKNSRKYPIKIISQVNGGKITVSIYGCKEEVEYEVIIQSQTLQKIPMKTEYRTNTALPKGTKKTVQKGHGGYKSRAYRILKLNGRVISKQLLSTDTYAQLSTIIEQNP